MKLYYKLIKNEEGKIIEIQSSESKYVEPNTLVTDAESLKAFKPLKSKIEDLNYYIVDDNGFCPLYEEETND
jgi:hypothetical protein